MKKLQNLQPFYYSGITQITLPLYICINIMYTILTQVWQEPPWPGISPIYYTDPCMTTPTMARYISCILYWPGYDKSHHGQVYFLYTILTQVWQEPPWLGISPVYYTDPGMTRATMARYISCILYWPRYDKSHHDQLYLLYTILTQVWQEPPWPGISSV